MKNSILHTTTGSAGCFAGKQFSLFESLIKNKNTFIVFGVLFQFLSPLTHNLVMGQCKPIFASNISSEPTTVEAVASLTPYQSAGYLLTPGNHGASQQGPGIPVNPANNIDLNNRFLNFSFSYDAGSGLSTWQIDFNDNGFFSDNGESAISQEVELENKGFGNLRLSLSAGNSSSFWSRTTIYNLNINGTDMGSRTAYGSFPVEQIYSGISGSLNDISVTGILIFNHVSSVFIEDFPFLKIELVEPVERTLCEVPIISHPTGTYEEQQSVSIDFPDPDASVYFTTNGNIPLFDVPNTFTMLYTGPIQVNQSTTIRAVAVKSGFPNSQEVVSYISINGGPSPVMAPVVSPGAGVYTSAQEISLSCETDSATIYYTTTGNVPVPGTSFTKIYSQPFVVHSSTQIRTFAVKEGMLNSPQTITNIVINAPTPVVSTPVISPGSGNISPSQFISIDCATPGSIIYYTTNGNVPLLSPWPNSFTRIYTGPFRLSARGMNTIRAMATAPSSINSQVTVANLLVINPEARMAFDENDSKTLNKEIQVYPNPSSGTFFVQVPIEDENLSFSVFTTDGKEVENGEFMPGQTSKLDLATLKSGLYLLRIKTDNGLKTIRLSKE